MNYGIVAYILGWILRIEGIMLLLPGVIGLGYGEKDAVWFFVAAAASLAVGFLLSFRKPRSRKIYAREGFVTVALAWLVMSLMGALPFTLSGEIPSYLDAVFETVSGFTTTGSAAWASSFS